MATSTEKLSPLAFEIVIWMLLGLAVFLAAIHTFIRIHKLGRLFIDDGLLFFATANLIAAVVMIHLNAPNLFPEAKSKPGTAALLSGVIQEPIHVRRLQVAITVLMAVTVFSAKLSCLFFVRRIVQQLRALTIWWWCVFVMVIPCGTFCMLSGFIACSASGGTKLAACGSDQALARQKAVFIVSTVLNPVTDALLISIPFAILWRVKISLRRKAALGATLCLSVFIIIISITRAIFIRSTNGQTDIIWATLWALVEAAFAVIVLSATAFRLLFVANNPPCAGPPRSSPALYSRWWNQKQDALTESPSISLGPAILVRTSITQRYSVGDDPIERLETSSTSGDTLVSEKPEKNWPLSDAVETVLLTRSQSEKESWPLTDSMV